MLVTGLGSVADGSGEKCFTDDEKNGDDTKDVSGMTHGPCTYQRENIVFVYVYRELPQLDSRLGKLKKASYLLHI